MKNNRMTGELFEIKRHWSESCLPGWPPYLHQSRMPLKRDYLDKRRSFPGKTLSEIQQDPSGGVDDQVGIYFQKTIYLFEFDQTMVVSRLIEGEYFPN